MRCPPVEGQAVRTAVGVALLTVCLGLAGCSLFGKKHAAQTNKSKPFLGSETPAKADTVAMPRDNGGPLPGANGVLAGRVVVEATGRPVRASISIKNRDREESKEASLDVMSNDDGYFTISRLNVGEHYELIARVNDNGELISQTLWATPPKATLYFALHKRYTTANTPPPKEMPKILPGKKGAAGRESAQERTPSVQIEAPVKLPEQDAQPRGANQSDAPTRANPSNIADGGFPRINQPSVPADIPGKPWSLPPVPGSSQWDSVPEQPPPPRAAPRGPSASGSVHMPHLPTPVPSCGLYGDKLDNFALYDLDGNVWEYKRDRRGRLLLLDFWHHNCHYCYLEIPELVELQRRYGRYGLQVVSIACEMGTVEEQRRNVRPIRGRYNINYPTLLSGGGPGRCPVMHDFQVDYFPCLVLIDEDGAIIWRSPQKGMDDNAHYILRKKIDDRLVGRDPLP